MKYENGLKTAMTDDKLQHLADMEFQWRVKENDDDVWNRRLEELEKFKEEHGHFRIPRKGQLGIWGKNERSSRVRASRSKVRTARLDEIGFFD